MKKTTHAKLEIWPTAVNSEGYRVKHHPWPRSNMHVDGVVPHAAQANHKDSIQQSY